MKVHTLFLTTMLASIAAAQAGGGLPDCAKSCADGFLRNGIGDCGTEVKCICENDNFLGDIACCLADVCDPADQSSAVFYASQLCENVGAKGLPTAVSCTVTSAGSGTVSKTPAPSTTGSVTNAAASSSSSGNYGPRQTAQAGLGALGGIVAAAIML